MLNENYSPSCENARSPKLKQTYLSMKFTENNTQQIKIARCNCQPWLVMNLFCVSTNLNIHVIYFYGLKRSMVRNSRNSRYQNENKSVMIKIWQSRGDIKNLKWRQDSAWLQMEVGKCSFYLSTKFSFYLSTKCSLYF